MNRPITLEEEKRNSDKVRILVFSGHSEENKDGLMKTASRLVEECKKRRVECFVAFVPFARSYKNDDGTRTVVNKDGKEFVASRFNTVVVVRGAASGQSGTLDMISAFEKDGFFVINSREAIDICSDKYRTSLVLAEADLPTPRTALLTDEDMIEDHHEQVGGKFPVVAKTLRGSKGIGVFILDSEVSLKSTIQAFRKSNENEELILQEYIPINNDMRIVVLDGEVTAVMKRDKAKGDFRSNFSMGAKVSGVKISKELKKLALDAAKAIGCYYCGVDIALSKRTKKPYILEVNSSPGSEGIEQATGTNIVGDFVDHIIDKENWMYAPTMVGRREYISIPGIGEVVGKFDTGNMVVNSIHADNFDVRGNTVTWTHGGKTFKNKLIDTVNVLQGGIAHNKETRPMIELDINFMGRNYPKRKFTLDDRSEKGTEVLIGVPFMKEFGFVVDPGRTFMKTNKEDQRRMDEEKASKIILSLAATLAGTPTFKRVLQKFGRKGAKFGSFLAGTPAFLHVVKRAVPQLARMDSDDIINVIDMAKNMLEGGSQLLMMGEQKLSKSEIKDRDKYAKDLKKRSKGFKDRYGDDYKDVIFGTATNMAKRKAEEEATDHEEHKGNLEGTDEIVKNYKKVTPGQVNEIADTYFNKGGSK
jgi:ribosomal protein S6--L-glutamate ligase